MYIFKKASTLAMENRLSAVLGKLKSGGKAAVFYGSRHYSGGKFTIIHNTNGFQTIMLGMVTAPTLGDFIERGKALPADVRNALMSVFIAACDDLPYSEYAIKNGIDIKARRGELSNAHLAAIKDVYNEILKTITKYGSVGVLFTQE